MLQEMTDESVIDYFYSLAVKGIKEEWFLESVDYPKWIEYVISLPNKEKVIYTLALLDEEVSNGGFEQYFSNKYGIFINEAYEALKTINADGLAKILERVIQYINPSEMVKNELVNKIINDDFEEFDFEEFDDMYYDSEDNLGELLVTYLRSDF